MSVILRYELATHIMNAKIFMCEFVANFVSYMNAKYYLNWLTVRKVITKIKR